MAVREPRLFSTVSIFPGFEESRVPIYCWVNRGKLLKNLSHKLILDQGLLAQMQSIQPQRCP